MTSEKLIQLIKNCAKNEEAESQLITAFEGLIAEKDKYSSYLELLEAAIRNDYDSILITDLGMEKPGPKIVYVNDGFTRMTGFTREEAIGKTPRILQGPKTDRATLDKLKQNLKEGKSFFGQTVNYRKDGSEFINQWDIHPLIDNNGNVTHWVSYQHDITERKRAEQNIFEGDTDINDAYESSKRTIVDINSDGRMVFANKSFRELSGYTKEELSRLKLWELLPNKQQKALAAQFSNVWNDKKSGKNLQVMIRRKNGSPVQVELELKKMSLDGGEILRADVRNLSLRKKVLENLKNRNSNFAKVFSPALEFGYNMAVKDGKPSLNWISDQCQEITGYTEEELSGENGWLKIVHEDDTELAINHFNKAINGTSSCELYRIVCKNGTVLPVMDYAKNIGDEIRGTITETAPVPA